MNWVKNEFGIEFKTDSFHMFYGNKNGSLDQLKKLYPQFEFRFLKQVHGNSCVLSSSEEVEADAHYTDEKNLALCIRTADCNPVLIGSDSRVCAIHAGWRGVKSRIVKSSIDKCFQNISANSYLALGPHIQKDSFQVDKALGEEFANDFDSAFIFQKPEHPDKSYVDLKSILLSEHQMQFQNHWASEEDTLTNEIYYSHRREPQNKGRNISFVARL